MPRLNFLEGLVDEHLLPAVAALPFDLTMKSPLYQLQRRGASPSEAVLTLPIPNEAEPYNTLDLYVWDGSSWRWLPSTLIEADQVIVSRLESLPELAAFALVQSHPSEAIVAANLANSEVLAQDAAKVLSEVNPPGAVLDDNGALILPDESDAPGDGEWRALPTVHNWADDGIVRSDLADNMLSSEVLRQKHIAALVAFAREGDHPGLLLDYRGLNPGLRQNLSAFIEDLAEQLHASGRTLSVRLEWPTQISAVDWDTGAYDWSALGRMADTILLSGPTDPRAYVIGGPVDNMLEWAARRIDRHKLQLAIDAQGVNQSETGAEPISYGAALAFLSQIAVDTAGEVVTPGDEISLSLLNLADSPGIHFDASIQTYWFRYDDEQGRAHTVWLENASSLTHKLQVAARHHLRGVTVEHLDDPMGDPALWEVVRAYTHGELQPQETEFAVLWEVNDSSGGQLAQSTTSLDIAEKVWTAPKTPGVYEYSVVIAVNGQPVNEKEVAVVRVEAYTPTPTPTPTRTPTGTPRPTSTPQPANTPAVPAPQVAPSVGYAFDYGIQAHAIGQDLGPIFDAIRQLGFRWLKVQVEWKNHEGSKGQYGWADLDRLVETAQLNGIKLLFSVVKAPTWARPGGTDLSVEGPPANPQDYADFVGAVAARYRGRVHAYEIWNEQNLHYEWGNEPLDANRYVQLLKLAYQAIKAQDPGAIVVSGAPTPTGLNDGAIAIDDRTYLQQMYNAGLRYYCDAIGVHPSGYANPPDSKFGEGPAGPSHSNHPSFFFRHTMEDYRAIMVISGDSNKRLWPTEFGWSTTHGLGAPPAQGYEYANYNTEQDQANYIVRAYQMAKAWGWVGPMFLWNLNYGPASGKFDEKAGFGIVYPNWAPRPAFYALANMPK
ncbi:MAG: hypothetical protein B6I34_09670 [Anaerolineaceae bacterium 4572_32.1]|nr:MAG: hypothetical protein B6I34_09670 [Anaerolineaceae bacterium 4572_32.1]